MNTLANLSRRRLRFHESFAKFSRNRNAGDPRLFAAAAFNPGGRYQELPLNQNTRILFVDDHEDTRFLISHLLGGLGYEVTAVESVEEGLAQARAGDFDLYLLDSRFADGSGADLCEGIREFDKVTPIIFYSGDHQSRLEKSLECDAQGFVLKPGFDALPRELERALSATV